MNIATIDTTSAIAESLGPTVVSRLSTSNGGHWGINVGRFNTRYAAEKMLLKTALAEIDALDGSLRKVHQSRQGFEATFLGLSEARAAGLHKAKRSQYQMLDDFTGLGFGF